MNTYTVYFGTTPIVCVTTEGAYRCFEAAKTLAEVTGKTASLVWDETGEEVASFDPKEDLEPTCECEARNCGYYYAAEGEEYPRCHFEGAVAPCEEEDDYYEDDDDLECGFDPYCGCYTDDC